MKLWSKVLQIFLLFSLYFSSLNLKYLKFTKMDITRFAMKLYKCYHECWVMIKTLVDNDPGQLSECNIGVKMSTFIHVSSVEGKKGAIKRCSIENQKGAITVQYLWWYSWPYAIIVQNKCVILQSFQDAFPILLWNYFLLIDTGWPRKNATTLIVNFMTIVDETELFFIFYLVEH